MPDEIKPPTLVEPPAVIEYEMKIRARIVGGLIASFTLVVLAWTFHPPQLPGDMAGVIAGGFIGWIGGLLTTWGTSKK